MIAAWMLYAVVVGALAGAAALVVERFLRSHGLPARWVWVISVAASIALPLGHWAGESRPSPSPPPAAAPVPSGPAAVPGVPGLPPAPVAVEVGPESVLRRLDRPILLGWGLATGALGLFLLVLLYRTHRLRRGWVEGRVGGEGVLLSGSWGPAVVGVVRPRIVLPRWCSELDGRTLRFILDHELEHVRAGDLRLLLLVGALPVLLPWHLPLWWQLVRLRAGLEGDCDLRVLRRHPGRTRSYIDLLLEMGTRPALPRPLAALLSEPYQTLKRRIRIMTMPAPKRPWFTGSVLAALAVALGGLACMAPPPTDASGDGGEAGAAADAGQVVTRPDEARVQPTFTPYSVLPELANRQTVAAALARGYAGLSDAPGGEPSGEVWYFIGEDGRVQDTRISRSTGTPSLDRAILEVAAEMEFEPALNRDQPRAVWVSLPVTFVRGGGGDTGAPVSGIEGRVVTRPAPETPPTGAGTGTLTGVVTDGASGQPLATAQVFVAGTRFGTLTNDQGRFRLEEVPAGTRNVMVHLVGYQEAATEVMVDPDGSAVVELGLRATAIPLTPLVVPVGG